MPLQTKNNLCFYVGTQINKGIISGPQRGWAVIEVISFAIFQSTEQAGKKPTLPCSGSISAAPAPAAFDTLRILPSPCGLCFPFPRLPIPCSPKSFVNGSVSG